jgi:hypothetical protein
MRPVAQARTDRHQSSARHAGSEPDNPAAQAEALSIPERLLLFCISSRTDWERAGITRATVTTTVVRGLIKRETDGGLTLTKQGRALLSAFRME